jgi:hypothetical protein
VPPSDDKNLYVIMDFGTDTPIGSATLSDSEYNRLQARNDGVLRIDELPCQGSITTSVHRDMAVYLKKAKGGSNASC